MDDRPIGVLDSGFGGISVLACAAKTLPQEDFIFLGDNLHAPYGDREPDEVMRFTRMAVDQLIQCNCKAIMIACNTATSVAAAALRSELSMPVIGMEPALKPASKLPGEGKILVMATAMTLKLEKFRALMARYGQDALPVPCPGLVELIEAGELEGPLIQAELEKLLSPYLRQPVKAVVLGCTHYVFLIPALRAFLPAGIPLVDGNEGTARQLAKRLTQEHLLKAEPPCEADERKPLKPKGSISFLSTARDAAIVDRMQKWYDLAIEEICNSSGEAVK